MRLRIFKILLFAVANFLLCWLHLLAFQSFFPFAAFVTVFLHITILIFFPYSKILNRK